jgi:hypothetical protein
MRYFINLGNIKPILDMADDGTRKESVWRLCKHQTGGQRVYCTFRFTGAEGCLTDTLFPS